MTVADKTFTSPFGIIPEAASGQALGDATHVWDLFTRTITFVGTPGFLYASYYRAWDQKAQNTAGGDFVLGAWRVRDLNQETDPDGIGALAGNQVTLDAGTYLCSVFTMARDADRHSLRLYNATGAAVVLVGTTSYCDTGTVQSGVVIRGRFTIAGGQALEVQHYGDKTQLGNGFGVEGNHQVEIYTIAEFWKEA